MIHQIVPCSSRSTCVIRLTIFTLVCCSNFCYGQQQQLLWLYIVPQSRLLQIPEPSHENRLDSSSEEFSDSVNPITYNSYIQDHVNNKPELYYQRSPYQNPPVITPLIIPMYGSEDYWQKRNKKDSREFVYGNFGEIILGNEKEEDSSDASSGSVESQLGIQKFSLVHHPSELKLIHGKKTSKGAMMPNGVNPCLLEGNQARFDPVTGSCHTVGTKGPCGDFMIFTTMPIDNFNGYCECDDDSFDRPLVHVGGQCHFLYTQALCYSGYWLVSATTHSEPICQLNPCQTRTMSTVDSISAPNKHSYVLFKGECIPLHSSSRHCRREGEVVLFPKGSTEAACGFPKSIRRIYRRQISNIGSFACGPGMKRHRITKKCIRRRAIVFG